MCSLSTFPGSWAIFCAVEERKLQMQRNFQQNENKSFVKGIFSYGSQCPFYAKENWSGGRIQLREHVTNSEPLSLKDASFLIWNMWIRNGKCCKRVTHCNPKSEISDMAYPEQQEGTDASIEAGLDRCLAQKQKNRSCICQTY